MKISFRSLKRIDKRVSQSAYVDLLRTCTQFEEETALMGIEVFNTSNIRLEHVNDNAYYLENVGLSATNANY